MGREGDAGDHGALGAGCLEYRQGSITYALYADHKPLPIPEDASTHNPLTKHTTQQEENSPAEEDIRIGSQAAGLYSSASAGLATGRHW